MKFIFSVTLTSTCFERLLHFGKKRISWIASQFQVVFQSYYEVCIFFALKQLIKVPTKTTTSSYTIIDHNLESYQERVTQRGVIDICLSDHQLIYCRRKIFNIKSSLHIQIQFRSFKHYKVDLFEQDLSKLNFPNYQNYNEIDEAYNDFLQKIISAIDKVAPIKERRVKQNSP